jgi:peptide/nickel transport system ATP-binding protein
MTLHLGVTADEARARTVGLLNRVGIPKPETRLDNYPFQLSGGMRQRAMIAMALSCEPRLLIADEPTTALDVTTQAQILDLIAELQEDYGMAVMFITHDLGVVAEVADEAVVMYLGTVAERGEVDDIFHDPLHPYTRALLRSIPKLGIERRPRLDSIRGMIPEPLNRPKACPFHNRCESFMPGICDVEMPPREEVPPGRVVRCWLHSDHSHLTTRQGAET